MKNIKSITSFMLALALVFSFNIPAAAQGARKTVQRTSFDLTRPAPRHIALRVAQAAKAQRNELWTEQDQSEFDAYADQQEGAEQIRDYGRIAGRGVALEEQNEIDQLFLTNSTATDYAPSITAVVNAASWDSTTYLNCGAADSIVAIFGHGLTNQYGAAVTAPLPTSFKGVQVGFQLGNNYVYGQIFFVSPQQINVVVPSEFLKAINGNGFVETTVEVQQPSANKFARGKVKVYRTLPGVFSVNSSGSGLAAAQILRVKSDGTQVYENVQYGVPIKFNNNEQTFLVGYATGIRNAALSAVSASINGVPVQVLYAGAQGTFAGLDQLNIPLDDFRNTRGTVQLALTVNGVPANITELNFAK